MNKQKTYLAVNGTMDTGCSLVQQWEWVVATHPGQVIGWLVDTPCEQSGTVSGLEPQSTNTSGVVSRHKPQSRNSGSWLTHAEIINEGTNPYKSTYLVVSIVYGIKLLGVFVMHLHNKKYHLCTCGRDILTDSNTKLLWFTILYK